MNRKSLVTRLKQPVWLISLLLPFALVLAACAGAAPAAQSTSIPVATSLPAATSAPAATMAANPTAIPVTGTEASINVATDPSLGKILVDAKGMTLYMFGKDTPDKSNCSGNCLKAWPPLLTQGSPVLGDGVDKSLVGSADLPDGTKIVTYNHMPLYYYIKDTKAGDVTGQNVGNVWFVVAPDGKPVGMQSTTGGTPAATQGSGSTAPSTAEATINVATDPSLGKILVDGKGMTLYMFAKDEADKSNCSGNCLKAWPPLVTQGSPVLGDGVDKSLVGSATMADGSKIVTYNHMPLYYYAKDTKAGDVTGQNVGNVWYVVSPEGKAVGMEPAAGSTAAPAAAAEPTINVATDPTLGKILVDGKGMTLYMFGKDEADKSNCSGNCLKAWPPLVTQGKPVAGAGVDASLFGSASLPDGTKIVTYNHMPLYYYAKDTKAGDVTGQNVGSVWFVVSPDGKPVGK